MSLDSSDQTQLARILKLARALERAWPPGDRNLKVDLTQDSRYQELKREIEALSDAHAEDLRRLAGNVIHWHDKVSLAHYYGCIVPFERLSGRTLRDDEFLVEEGDGFKHRTDRLPLQLIVENLRSAFNVGALFRTSECLGVSEIWLCGYTPGPEDAKVAQTAMGTSPLVPWRRVDRARTACEELRTRGHAIIALETSTNASSLTDIKFDEQPIAFVVGNERFGIDAETLHAVDLVCRIPMRGIKNSMNVGVAFGIAAFEWIRQHESRR